MTFFLTALATAVLVGIARNASLALGRRPIESRVPAAAPLRARACVPAEADRRAA